MVQAAAKTGGTVPENMAKGILEGKAKVSDAVNVLYDQVESVARSRQIMAPEAVTINTAGAAKAVSNSKGDLSKTKIRSTATTVRDKTGVHTIYRNALGGIYNRQILTTVAEEGAEAIIPLDGSNRGKNLWMRAGQMLGMFGKNTQSVSAQRDIAAYNSVKGSAVKSSKTSAGQVSGNTGQPITVKYSPKIVIEGSADKKAVEQALDISQKKFEQLMDRYNRTHKRISFGGAS